MNFSQAWEDWANGHEAFLVRSRSVYSGYYDQSGPDDKITGLFPAANWPDVEFPDYSEDTVLEVCGDDCWFEHEEKVYEFTKACVYYVAYPLHDRWDGSDDPESASEATWECDFNMSQAVVIANGPQDYDDVTDKFQAFCEKQWADGNRQGWLLMEEGHRSPEDFVAGERAEVSECLYALHHEESCAEPKFLVLPVSPAYWGDYDLEEIERDVENARQTLRRRGLSLVETVYPNTDCHKELWGCPLSQEHSLESYRDEDTIYNQYSQDVTWREQNWDIHELATESNV